MAEGFIRQSFSLPSPMLSDLKKEAAKRDLTLSQLLREYIRHGRLRDAQGELDLRREDNTDGH
jgi:hypothetical protein